MLPALQRTVVLLKRRRLHWAMVPAICLVVSWRIKEVVAPVLPLPLPRISSHPSIPFNSLPRRLNKEHRNYRRALLEDINLALL